LKNDYKGIS
jgi:hypothetical protein